MQSILTVNGGSSSIRFAVYETGETLERRLGGKIDRVGANGTNLIFGDPDGKRRDARRVAVADHRLAAAFLLDRLVEQPVFASVKAVGHRVVQGMQHSEPEVVTPKLLAKLHRITRYHSDHLPREIELIEAFRLWHPKLYKVACFDKAFHRTIPQGAKLLPIPRHYAGHGVERYGLHRLSYAYLTEELARTDPGAARGRAILAHLGNGAGRVTVRVIRTDEELRNARSVARSCPAVSPAPR